MGKKRRSSGPSAQEVAAQQEAARLAQQTKNMTANFRTDLQTQNAPEVQTSAVGAEDTTLVGGTSIKRRRATGALSSQLGINT